MWRTSCRVGVPNEEERMPVYSYEGIRPRVSRSAFVHPDAVLIGDVELGPEASVWPTTVLRGDHGRIVVGARTSIQDGTIVHTTEEWPTLVGAGCVVGHNVHLEGCVIEDGCLVGSMSTVLNRAHVGAGSVVAAAALVPEGLRIPANSMAMGVPARVRPITGDEHRLRIERAAAIYVENARHYPTAMAPIALADCLE
jgi:carbonic anhydrase/acetyltransferase-like protein (isoleucine patch superfamily)